MNNYNIDIDIKLYTYGELETMQRIYENKNANHAAVPFKLEEIKAEIYLRNNIQL